MVEAFVRNVDGVAVPLRKFLHHGDRRGLVIVRTEMHALHAEAFLVSEKFRLRKIHLFFASCLGARPLKFRPGHKIRQTDKANPAH